MKRFGWRLVVFALALSVPLAYFVARTYRGMAQEENARLRFFAETLFDKMERDLAVFVGREEARPVDAYAPTAPNPARPEAPFVVGYLQNNPDGSLQIPVASDAPGADRLRAVNALFNEKREAAPPPPPVPAPRAAPAKGEDESWAFADRFFRPSPTESYLGRRKKRTEALYPEQALQVAPDALEQKAVRAQNRAAPSGANESPAEAGGMDRAEGGIEEFEEADVARELGSGTRAEALLSAPAPLTADARRRDAVSAPLQAEVGPLQSVFVDEDTVVLFRRVVLGDRLFRQGVVVRPGVLMEALIRDHFESQPLAGFSRLALTASGRGRTAVERRAGSGADGERIALSRTFPRPFAFLRARLTAAAPPPSDGRRTLTVMIGLLSGIVVLGLFAIHRSARTVTELAERRSAFVSAVTHELKTPLTTIRMYIEMLASGMAATPEREQDYFTVLNAEAARLSRLIQNILDFSKLERREFRVRLQTEDPAEAVRQARSLMEPAAERAGFRLIAEIGEVPPIPHDRELLVQVLVNLVENSLKFGAETEPKEVRLRLGREGDRVVLSVADTGPGVPRKALKKIFEEFYRVDGALTRRTRGTGIGLAFVRRAVAAMGGEVRAANNDDGPGCAVTIRFPVSGAASAAGKRKRERGRRPKAG